MAIIEVRSLGRKKRLLSDFSVSLDAEGDETSRTVRQVIEEVVRKEVDAFRSRQQGNRFLRALSAEEIETDAAVGKISAGGSDIEPQHVSIDRAIDTALTAFDDGIYLVVIDGRQIRSLDEQVEITKGSKIAFIRLTMLMGG